MVILLSLLGSNLFIAVITYGYNQVVTREHLCKVRLGEISRDQDGSKAVHYMQGDLNQVSLDELLEARGLTVKGSDGRNIEISDTSKDGRSDAVDLSGDGSADSKIVEAQDTTGDGKADTLIVQSGYGISTAFFQSFFLT